MENILEEGAMMMPGEGSTRRKKQTSNRGAGNIRPRLSFCIHCSINNCTDSADNRDKPDGIKYPLLTGAQFQN